MGSIGNEELVKWEKMQIAASDEEKILVLVRLRPLSEKEIIKNDTSEWECINDTTILFRNSLQERFGFPSAYSFDRVFRGDCSTRQVYDDAAKEVALSVVGGINSTIFAYGQTSSGKTYTMTGITEYTVADIYDYMFRHDERAFALKFSAIEIYNEVVRDLLSIESTPLRILDDPEKGTIVEKLTEEILKDWNHLKELLSICEAQRQTGETSLNETSSRSHQILKLTIESSAREFLDKDKSATLSASVNFVDLAGSERASQALSVGTRLKEGCHINRSLLTLGTVIRKLSKGRQSHINYRDSKLTRILQPSLGGNARTAIICTLCPARTHVEQSRNTLLFASCAKEVTTNAHVNVVMSDKALVKHLQKEVARLECELRTPAPISSTADYGVILRKKDLQIDRMEKEIKTLTKQRNLAEARVEDLLRVIENNQTPKQQPLQKDVKAIARQRDLPESRVEDHQTPGQQSVNDSCNTTITWQIENDDDEFSVSSIMGNSNSLDPSVKVFSSNNMDDLYQNHPIHLKKSEIIDESDNLYKDVQCIEMQESSEGQNYTNEAQEPESVSSIQQIVEEHSHWVRGRYISSCRTMKLKRSQSCGSNIIPDSEENASTPLDGFQSSSSGKPEGLMSEFVLSKRPAVFGTVNKNDDSESSVGSALVVDVLNGQEVKPSGDSDITSVHTFVSGLQEMAELHYGKEIDDGKVEKDCGKSARDVGVNPMQDWVLEFERQQKAIIELWHTCNVPLVHRTYFFLLFKGDTADSIYMEVEFRRLSFIKDKISQGVESVGSARREKETLCKLMRKRLSRTERESMYGKWGIGLESKRRRWQVVQRLWSDTRDADHIKESARIVAKLVGFCEQQRGLTESLGLSFSPPFPRRRSFWRKQRGFATLPLSRVM